MPTFKIYPDYSAANYNWSNFWAYDLVKVSGTDWRLVYDEDEEGPLGLGEPAEIEVKLKDGAVTGLRYLDEDGNLLAALNKSTLAAKEFERLHQEAPDDLFDALAAKGLKVTGGETANDDWNNHDDITTSIWDDKVEARGGNDYMKDHGGADVYDGGSGNDQLSYDEWDFEDDPPSDGIVADLKAGTVVGPDGETDEVRSIEGVRGYSADDIFAGDGQDNFFMGLKGKDVFDGRGGFDIVSHHWDTRFDPGLKVKVDLSKGVAVDGWGFKDKLTSIEGARGSGGGDKLIDNEEDNYFDGDAGDDHITLSRGDDVAVGDEGADTFVFKGDDFGTDSIDDFDGEAGDRIRIKEADDLGDLKINVEDGDTIIKLDGDAQVILEDYAGPVDPYLDF